MTNKKTNNEIEFKRVIVETLKSLNNKYNYLKGLMELSEESSLDRIDNTEQEVGRIIFVLWFLFMLICGSVALTLFISGQ